MKKTLFIKEKEKFFFIMKQYLRYCFACLVFASNTNNDNPELSTF